MCGNTIEMSCLDGERYLAGMEGEVLNRGETRRAEYDRTMACGCGAQSAIRVTLRLYALHLCFAWNGRCAKIIDCTLTLVSKRSR